MQSKKLMFIDDEPLVIEMMMNVLSEGMDEPVRYEVFEDPDLVADLIENGQVGENHIIVVDRFLFQRDTLDMQLPNLFRRIGFEGPVLVFSYVPIDPKAHGYDEYLKKDLGAVGAFRKWLL